MSVERTFVAAAAAALLAPVPVAAGELIELDQFSPKLGTLVACGFDTISDTVWVYGDFDPSLSSYTSAGEFLALIPRPGEPADDADIEIAPEELTIGAAVVPAGTLLFINGESGLAEIYAVDPSNGAVLGTLPTTFGNSHVVGGAYHPGRDTFFLVQDQHGGPNANVVAEVSLVTGMVLNSFSVAEVLIVNYGDIEVHGTTGNLLLVSSIGGAISEFTPAGAFLGEIDLPADVGSLSGIGVDDEADEMWVGGVGGTVWRLGNCPLAGIGDFDGDADVDGADLGTLLLAWGDCPKGCCPPDLNGDSAVDGADLGMLLLNWTI